MMKTNIFLLFSVCLLMVMTVSGSPGEEHIDVYGIGSSLVAPLFQQYFYSWVVLRPQTHFDYQSASSQVGIDVMISPNITRVWGGTELLLTEAQKEEAKQNGKDLIFFPAAISPVTPFPNMRSLRAATRKADFQLSLTPRALALIYTGDIIHWNDPLIVATNPDLQSVNEEIRVVIRSEPSGTTLIFQTALVSFLEPGEWPFGNASNVWTPEMKAKVGSRLIQSPPGGSGPIAEVLTTNFTICYAAEILVTQSGAGANYFNLSYGNTTVNVAKGMLETGNIVTFDQVTNELQNVELPPNCWPIYGVSYILFNTNYTGYTKKDCKPNGEAARFFIWILTTPAASRSALDLDFVAVQGKVNPKVVDMFLHLQCAGEPLIGNDFIDQRKEAVWNAMLILGMVSALVPTLIFVGTLVTKQGVNRLGYSFTLSTLGGAILLLMSVILFYLVPNNDSVCILRTWFVGIGNVLLIVPVATQVFFLTLTIYRSKTASQSQLTFGQILMPIILFVGLQCIILICWVAIDPYSSTVVVINQYERTAYYICSSDNNWIWFGLEIAFFALLLLMAFILNWYARNTSLTQLHYVTWMGFTVYNLLMFLVILVPILAGFDPPEALQYFVVTMGLIYPALFTCLSLYGPIFLPNLFRGLPGISNLRSSSKTEP